MKHERGIVQFISSGGFYGAERVVVELAAHLQTMGWRSHVAALESPGATAVLARARAVGVPGITIPAGMAPSRASTEQLREYVLANQLGIVHSHGYRTDVFQLLAQLPGKIARVATCHTWYSETTKLRAYEAMDKAALRLFDHVAVVSPQLLQEVRDAGLPRARTSMVENGVGLAAPPPGWSPDSLRSGLGATAGELMVLRVGRLSRSKGNDMLLEASADLLRRGGTRLVLVGEGPQEEALVRQAQELGIQHQVTFAGYRQDIPDLLHAADLMVISSHQEGLPMVLLEAMAARLPVVATGVGAIGRVIENGRTGWLVPPGEQVELQAALGEALESSHLRQGYAIRALKLHKARFSREAMGQRYIALYEAMLQGMTRRGAARRYPLLTKVRQEQLPRLAPISSEIQSTSPGPKLARAPARKVALLLDELHLWRGTETHLFRLLQHMDRSRIEPMVLVLGKDGLSSAFMGLGVPFHSLKVPGVFSPAGALGLKRLTALLRQEEARLLVSYHTASDLLAPLAGAASKIPVLSSRRDMGFTKKAIHVRIQRKLNMLLCGMLSVSHAVAAEVERTEGFPRDLNRVIWNGEDLDRFSHGPSRTRADLGLDRRALVITSVGSLSQVKDHRTLLNAFNRLVVRHPEARLVLAGDGPMRAILERQAAHLAERVLFLGQRSDIPELLRASDIYLQTSRSEGFSNAILQAMATSLPVVATRVGGNPELVTARSGMLAEVGDAQGLAAALEHLAGSRTMRRSMGAAGRAWARAYGSIEVMAADYEEAFCCAMDGDFTARSEEHADEEQNAGLGTLEASAALGL